MRYRARMRRIAVRVVTLFALMLAANGQAAEGGSTDESGEWTGDHVRVKWRTTHHTKFSPETAILIESSVSRARVFTPRQASRTCNGAEARTADSATLFHGSLFDRANATSELDQGRWDVWLVPRGILARTESTAAGECVMKVAVQAFGRGGGRDDFVLTLPMHHPPMDPHRR